MSPEDFYTYPGTVDRIVYDRARALAFTPGHDGYARFVTLASFIPPVRVAGWVALVGERNPGKLDGIHLHLGHVGNARNYVCSLVRKDGDAKIAVEFGWKGYTSLVYADDGPALVRNRVYHFEALWLPDAIHTTLASEAGTHSMGAEVPEGLRIPQGGVGFRLDRYVAVGDLTVREL